MSDGIPQKGQQFDRSLNFAIPFVETMLDRKDADIAMGTAATEITPNDAGSALERNYDEATIDAAFNAINIQYSEYVSLDLPDVLTGITVGFNTSSGNGAGSQSGTGASEGTSSSMSLSLHSSSQGNANILPDILPAVREYPKNNIPATVYLFFIKGNVTSAAILTKLTTLPFANAAVLALPVFFKQPIYLTIRGQQASVNAAADVQQRVEVSASNVTQTLGSGTSYSNEGGLTTRQVTIPATLHAALTLSGASSTATASATATAAFTSGTNWSAETATQTEGPVTVTGSVTPTSIPATVPTDIPRTGLYMTRLDVSPLAGFGYSQIRAVVVNMAIFA